MTPRHTLSPSRFAVSVAVIAATTVLLLFCLLLLLLSRIVISPVQEVEEVHKEFVSRIQKVFDQHKAAYGWPNKTLVVR